MFDFNIGLENFANGEHSVLFVCLMGIGTVFVGLICLILLCKLLGVFRKEDEQQAEETATSVVVQPAMEQPIENKQELLAAISAAVAEELGTDVNGIRITSFKKL